MNTAATLQCQCLFNAGLHVSGFLQFLVIEDKTAFPQGTDCLDTLEFVRLLAFVRHDRQLVSTQIPFCLKLIQNDILHEVRFHKELHGCRIACTFVEVVKPPHHSGNGILPDVAVYKVQFLPNLAPKPASLVVVGSGRFERGVGIADQHFILGQSGQFLVTNPVCPKNSSVHDGVVHHLLLPCPVPDKIPVFLRLLFRPFLAPYRLSVLVCCLDDGHMHTFSLCNVRQYRVFGN